MAFDLKEIYTHFSIEADIEPYGNGHINDTYLCENTPRYILQKINSNVFKKPDEVMENIYKITKHLRKKIEAYGGNPDRETLTVIPTIDGKNFYKDSEDNYFRMYTFVENSLSYDFVENPIQLYHAGKAFGKFQNMLSDFPADELHETIIDFHNTPERVNQLLTAEKNDDAGRRASVEKELNFAKKYAEKYANLICSGLNDGSIKLRVTHNDTKLNNVLFDANTKEGLCVIDLDTVMPGSLLCDFGDALRFGASSSAEDETDLDKVYFDLEKFEQFAKGFLEEVASCLTEREIELLPYSALILTYECGIRFLADYLNGDKYFKIHRENHNLDRARNQFKLVYDIESKLEDMKKIVSNILA